MSIGDRLKVERMRFSMTEADFAEIGGQKSAHVPEWEAGSDYPDAPALAIFAGKGVDVYYALTGNTGPRNKEESDLLSAYRECEGDTKTAICDMAEKGAAVAKQQAEEFKRNLLADT